MIKHPVHQSGSASFNQIYNVAYFLVHECVMGDGVGGYATNLGTSVHYCKVAYRHCQIQELTPPDSKGPGNNMALEITSYRPFVHCTDNAAPSPRAACSTIVDSMPANYVGSLSFGSPGDPDVLIVLPYKFTERMAFPISSLCLCRGTEEETEILVALTWTTQKPRANARLKSRPRTGWRIIRLGLNCGKGLRRLSVCVFGLGGRGWRLGKVRDALRRF